MIEELIIKTVDMFVTRSTSKLVKYYGEKKKDVDFLKRVQKRKMVYAQSWCKDIQLLKMSRGKDLSTSTIELSFGDQPRDYISDYDDSIRISELEITYNNYQYAILGDPGSGKTTTLKRIARKLIDDYGENERTRIPFIIRCRDIDGFQDIYRLFAEELGINYKYYGEREAKKASRDEGVYVGDVGLKDVVLEFFKASKYLILVDGLDELPVGAFSGFVKGLEDINMSSIGIKMIITCRTADYRTTIQGFNVIRILPLNPDEVRYIISAWTQKENEFKEKLQKLPYHDLTDRPLLLIQLLILFNRYGTFPEQPAGVYERIVNLFLREWDADRNIIRMSKYAGFEPSAKLKFLAELAFYITYKNQEKRFNRRSLLEIYEQIHSIYNLPAEEAVEVAQELESHTGIVVESGRNYFEFSHLSIQEYLCAEYIVKMPIGDKTKQMFMHSPGVMAIVLALSSNPSSWFVTFYNTVMLETSEYEHTVVSFLSRVALERPYFDINHEFGKVLLYLYDYCARKGLSGGASSISQIVKQKNASHSILKFLASSLHIEVVRQRVVQKKMRINLVRINILAPLREKEKECSSITLECSAKFYKEYYSHYFRQYEGRKNLTSS